MNLKLVTNIGGSYNSVARMIINYMVNESGIKEIFATKVSRLASSDISALIEVDGNYVGFVNLLKEYTKNMLFVDIGILEQYRGNGYAKAALEYIKDLDIKEYIMLETKSSNEAASTLASNAGCLVYQHDDRNFYLLRKELKDEFVSSDDYDDLKDHCENYGSRIHKKSIFDGCY